ncbi:MAG: hypothetical protein KBD67_04930 [Anaerolineaceae bacterium]|nr:hypothetical protein [Anaerolineaceae bacterium]
MRNRINFRILTSIALSGLLLTLVLLSAVAQSAGTLTLPTHILIAEVSGIARY